MSPAEPRLLVEVSRRVHAKLTLDASLSLGSECGVLFGSSGAGKTTLLRLIAGLETPDRGRIRLGDDVLYDSDAKLDRPLRRRGIGMIFQDDLLFPHMNVAANIRYGLKGRGRAEADARLAEIASLCGVESLLDRSPTTLSGGERQRVGLARALAPRPRLLLCDEPFSALDVMNRHILVERLKTIQQVEAVPILYVTHSPAEAVALGTQLFWVSEGRIVARGNPLDVLASSHVKGTTRLNGIRNLIRGRLEPPDQAGESRLRLGLDEQTVLVIPAVSDHPPGAELTVEVRADDILLGCRAVSGLSARNVIPGVVERLVPHGDETEVLVQTGSVTWISSVVNSAVDLLGLEPGTAVNMIIKARSCRVLDAGSVEE